jgi:hypothetical protein
MRHNPDLDEAMGFGPPKAPEPAAPPPPPSPTSVVMLAAEINRLVTAIGSLSVSKPFQQQQGKGQQQAAPRPPSNAPLIAALTVLTGSVNRLNTTLQKPRAGQPPQPAAAAGSAKKRRGKGRKPNWFMRRLIGNSGQNPAGRAGRFLHKFSGKKGVAGTGAGKFAGAAGGVLMAVGVLGEFSKSVKESTDRLIEVNRQYAQFSSQMSLVMAQRDIREMQRKRQVGDDTADSAKALADSEQKRKDAGQNLETIGNKISNYIEAGFNEVLTAIISIPDGIAEAIERAFTGKGPKEKEDKPLTAGEALDAVRQDYERQNARHAPWFNRRPM